VRKCPIGYDTRNNESGRLPDREMLRIRFLNVIRGAGYVNDAPESICNRYLDEYMKDVPAFIKMMEDYEKNDYDPD
jgi:hypothetical protein